jgi:hypothetical protein
MPTKVEVHSTAKIAVKALSIALLVGFSLLGIKRFLNKESNTTPAESITQFTNTGIDVRLLLPTIILNVPEDAHETAWSKALATYLDGVAESQTEGGRIDVETTGFAIEVERLEKWHEAIGQSAHYALATKKQPVAAFIILSDEETSSSIQKIKLIEETCMSKGIRLVLLKSKMSPTKH